MRAKDYLVKYRGLTKGIRIVSQIGFWLIAVIFLVGLVLGFAALSGGFSALLPLMESLSFSVDGILRFDFSTAGVTASDLQNVLATMFLTISAFSVFYGIFLRLLIDILKAVEKDTPFVHDNANRLQKMGYALIVGSFVVGIAYAAMSSAVVAALQFDAISVNYQINTNMFATGLIMFVLSGIFRYGAYLQDEYDSTL